MTYSIRLRSCKLIDAFIISSLPSILTETLPTAGRLCSADITPLHRYYAPFRHPLAVGRFPGVAGYTAYLAPAISGRDEEGFSSCLAHPCHHAVGFTPPEEPIAPVRFRSVLRPSPIYCGLGLRGQTFRDHVFRSLSLRPDDLPPPPGRCCRWASAPWFPYDCAAIRATGF